MRRTFMFSAERRLSPVGLGREEGGVIHFILVINPVLAGSAGAIFARQRNVTRKVSMRRIRLDH